MPNGEDLWLAPFKRKRQYFVVAGVCDVDSIRVNRYGAVAARITATSFAGEREKERLSAGLALELGESVTRNAASEMLPELLLDVFRMFESRFALLTYGLRQRFEFLDTMRKSSVRSGHLGV